MELSKDKVKVVKAYHHLKCDCGACLEIDVTEVPQFRCFHFTCPMCGKHLCVDYIPAYMNLTYKQLD